MKKPFLLVFACLTASVVLGQDHLVLVSGDTLPCQIVRLSAGKVTIKDGVIERELSADFVSGMTFESGKKTVFKDIPVNGDYGKNFFVLPFSNAVVSEMSLLFPSARKQTFSFRHRNKSFVLPQERFLSAPQGDTKHSEDYLNNFVTLGMACNSFLALVESIPGEIRYTFYSNPISAEKVQSLIMNHSYRLVDSQAIGNLLELADATLKPFTMQFREAGKCDYTQDNKLTILEYALSKEGQITFVDSKKRNKGTTYQIVHITSQTIRYTLFSSLDGNLITRRVERVQGNH